MKIKNEYPVNIWQVFSGGRCDVQMPPTNELRVPVDRDLWRAIYLLLDHRVVCSKLEAAFPEAKAVMSNIPGLFSTKLAMEEDLSPYHHALLTFPDPEEAEKQRLRLNDIGEQILLDALREKYPAESAADFKSESIPLLIQAGLITEQDIETLSDAGKTAYLEQDLGL